MPLTGELEHLPIVDVIQLIYSTRKTGTLNVYSRKGEGQLVFNNGYIVGATHSDEKLRIGQILCEANIITADELDRALKIQESASSKRKPLIATLFEHGSLSKEAAFKALETLIEMTIVEMISWTKGIFSLEMDKIHISDEYRYLPTQLQELNLDTQMVLMDALRIFDEKVHAGEIVIVDEPLDDSFDPMAIGAADDKEPEEELIVSEDILGLADLDKIERKKPHVFKSLEVFEPIEIHRQIIASSLPNLSREQQVELAELLVEIASIEKDENEHHGPNSQAIIMYGDDQFLQHATMTLCQNIGLLFFSATEPIQLNSLVSRALNKNLEPVLLFDRNANVTEVQNDIRSQLGDIFQIIELTSEPLNKEPDISPNRLNNKEKAVFSKPKLSPSADCREQLKSFLTQLQIYLQAFCRVERRQHFSSLRRYLDRLQKVEKAPDISLLVLQYIGEIFERTLTLIVSKSELISERSIGFLADKNEGVCAAQKIKIPIEEGSLFSNVIQSGQIRFDSNRDDSIVKYLFHEMGAPLESTLFLAPLTINGRTITLTYADFGNEKSSPVSLDLISLFIEQAGHAMKNALTAKAVKSTQ